MNSYWGIITENFNNREIAGAIWLLLALAFFSFKHANIRHSGLQVIRSIFASKLLAVFGGFAAWVAIQAWVGKNLGFWDFSQTVPTIFWYFVGGLPLLFRAFDAKEDSQHFRGYAKAAISGTALIEFIYGVKTFCLLVELALTPIVTIIAMLAVFSERDPKNSQANTLTNWLLIGFAVVVFWNSISKIVANPADFFATKTLYAFAFPIYFTIGSIPFFYALHCYSHIERALMQIDQKTFQSRELKRYAERRFIFVFFARPWLILRAIRQFHNLPAREKKDVDDIIRDVLRHEQDKKNPPMVDARLGWSPYLAREFLSDEGIRPNDYHESFDDQWWSGVASKDLSNELLPSVVNYSTSGTEGIVQKLKLKGHFVNKFLTEDALDEFSRIGAKLCERALSHGAEDLKQLVSERQNFQSNANNTVIRLRRESFSNGNGFELILELERPVD